MKCPAFDKEIMKNKRECIGGHDGRCVYQKRMEAWGLGTCMFLISWCSEAKLEVDHKTKFFVCDCSQS